MSHLANVVASGQFFRSGYYYTTPHTGATASSGIVNGDLRAIPLDVPHACTLDRIGLEVTAAGAAGSVIRLGISLDDGAGLPGALLLDAGTIDGTSVTNQALTISQAVPRGRLWLYCVAQGAPATNPSIRSSGSSLLLIPQNTAPSSSTLPNSLVMASQTGALGAFTASSTSSILPRVYVRVA